MLFGTHGMNKPICFGLVIFSFVVCLCIVSFQNLPSNQKRLSLLPSFPNFSLFSDSKVNCNPHLEEPQQAHSKHDWRKFWTEFFANKNSSQYHLNKDMVKQIVKNDFIDWPPSNHKEINFSNPPKLEGQFGMPVIIDKILGGKRNGFFVEAGGYDGETHSNTVLFELERNWTGLMIEPSNNYEILLTRNRKVSSIRACLSLDSHPSVVEFMSYKGVGGIKGQVRGWAKDTVKKNAQVIQSVCFPFHSILFAIGNPTVDYFSLDIEGIELDVLKTIPWDQVDIKIFSIEVGEGGGVSGMGRDNGVVGGYGNDVTEMMTNVGYTKVLSFCCGDHKIDHVYVKNDLRSPIFKNDGKPRLMKEVNLELVEV